MEQKKADILIVKLFENNLSQEEAEWLSKWLKDQENLVYFNRFVAINHLVNTREKFDYRETLTQVNRELDKNRRKRKVNLFLRYAAVIVILLGIGGGVVLNNQNTTQEPSKIVDNTIKAGSKKAVLVLGDGTEVSLHEGKTYTSKNARSKGQKLVYNNEHGGKKTTESVYNYLTVPRGGQFSLKLSDGTRVWLNSDSKLKYPVKFSENQARCVQLVYGEAYFDVSPSEEHHGTKFKVGVNQMRAEVLGTEFNIKAYEDENAIYTTLVEGKVKLQINEAETILTAHQQAVLSKDDNDFKVRRVASFNQTLWKDGIFSFKNKSLQEIMKVLSRWYDMKVVFDDPDLEEIKFTGVMAKKQPIKEVMSIMQETNNINYSITHKTITIK